jgi:hypothetical protein
MISGSDDRTGGRIRRGRAFFETSEQLVSGDADASLDVYGASVVP